MGFDKKEYQKAYRLAHPEKGRENSKKYYYTHREEIIRRKVEYDRSHLEERREAQKQRRIKVKAEVLTHYGNGQPCCVCCGFNDIRGLNLDHIDNNGYIERMETGRWGYNFYLWLKQRGYPEGYQTLCANCNLIKRFEVK